MNPVQDFSIRSIQRLVSLPPAACRSGGCPSGVLAVSDPPGVQLGSGGGTANLLVEAWKREKRGRSFESWLGASMKVLVHGSGESRRLPAYGACGKPQIPVPAADGSTDASTTLLDLQFRSCEQIAWHAPLGLDVMLACGDVLVRYDEPLPSVPHADVVIVGLPASHDEARRHGVMVCRRDPPYEMVCFLQKPSDSDLQRYTRKYSLMLDTGMWLFSRRAIGVMMSRCGWDAGRQKFRKGAAGYYDLFGVFGPALGSEAIRQDREINRLNAAVLVFRGGRFLHFGSHDSLIDSALELRRKSMSRQATDVGEPSTVVIQNSEVKCSLKLSQHHVWIENSVIPADWSFSDHNIITNIPLNTWGLNLDTGVCLDVTPVRGGRHCIRVYGFADVFRGRFDSASTRWCGRPALKWFSARGMDPERVGIPGGMDMFDAPVFPVFTRLPSAGFVKWLTTSNPAKSDEFAAVWEKTERFSMRRLLVDADVSRMLKLRRTRTSADGAFAGKATARDRDAGRHLVALRESVIGHIRAKPVRPVCNILEGQLVWGRSPVRLDLAGGWTDTPPYCIEHGGNVVNVAVDLNGQPPVQVFARISKEPALVIRSVDLGVEERISTYADLQRTGALGSGFGIGKAALSLAGFSPSFHARGGYKTLRRQLDSEMGGGIEISMVCAIPKGSGLGTSSILAATILSTLSDLCGLSWSKEDVVARTLALEQMLTAGGGWQDQVGGLFGGVKFVKTQTGLEQKPTIRWLPSSLFADAESSSSVLLYYTGITRVAHDILGEIVGRMFSRSEPYSSILESIGRNAEFAADAIQCNDRGRIAEAVRRSWQLNQRLDSGTNPAAIRAIVNAVSGDVDALKLLGAGGGGYMLMLAKDSAAAGRIRRVLSSRPPNPHARFVSLSVSDRGTEVTRS